MSDSSKCIEVSFDLSADNLPDALRDAIEKSGMEPEDYMYAAIENIRHIATLLSSCVDLYKDKKPALDYLDFSLVADSTVARGTDSHVSVAQVVCGDHGGILYSVKSLLQETLEDAFKIALNGVFEEG